MAYDLIALAFLLAFVGIGLRVWWIERKAAKASAWLNDWYHDEGMLTLPDCEHCREGA